MPQNIPEYVNTNKGMLLQRYGNRKELARDVMQSHVVPLLRGQTPEDPADLEGKLLSLGKSLWVTGTAKNLRDALKKFGTGINPELLIAYLTEFSTAAFGDYGNAAKARDCAASLLREQPLAILPFDNAGFINALNTAVLSYTASQPA